MIVADAVRALALGSLAVALAFDDFTLAQVVAVAFVEGTMFVFFSLSESAALPFPLPSTSGCTRICLLSPWLAVATLALMRSVSGR